MSCTWTFMGNGPLLAWLLETGTTLAYKRMKVVTKFKIHVHNNKLYVTYLLWWQRWSFLPSLWRGAWCLSSEWGSACDSREEMGTLSLYMRERESVCTCNQVCFVSMCYVCQVCVARQGKNHSRWLHTCTNWDLITGWKTMGHSKPRPSLASWIQ